MKIQHGSARLYYESTEDIVRLYRNIKNALGVSATHLDWTMVPYVRMSFFKHFKDGMKYIAGNEIEKKSRKDLAELSINDTDRKSVV